MFWEEPYFVDFWGTTFLFGFLGKSLTLWIFVNCLAVVKFGSWG